MERVTLPSFQVVTQQIVIHTNPGGHWKIKKARVRPGPVTWTCDDDCFIWILFPPQRNPIVEGEPFGQKQVNLRLNGAGYYPYCVLVQGSDGSFHLVEGNSPPEMELV